MDRIGTREVVGGRLALDGRRTDAALRLGDLTAVLAAYTVVLTVAGLRPLPLGGITFVPFVAAATAAWALRSHGLWAGVARQRAVELAGLVRVAGLVGGGVLVLDRLAATHLRVAHVVVATFLAATLLVVGRSARRAVLAARYSAGVGVRRTVVLGTGRAALDLVRIAEIHPEAGTQVVGLVGSRRQARAAGHGAVWIAERAELAAILALDPDVVVVADDVHPALVAALGAAGVEVYVHPGLSGIDARRLSTSTLVHQPLLHVAPDAPSVTRWVVKRVFDVVVASVLLVVAAPVMLVVAWWIRREDGGPVFFRQQRVGQNDVDFGMIKFRTMGVDAEARLASLQTANQRSGPLFKLGVDPRVTRIGRVLRATSLDELPQLLNVVKGEMSLVGPRPALRSEVAAFPIELHQRHRVRPGITGLWQVEARDNPAFDAYQRLDLFYVENWSLALDLVILLATAEQMLLRPFLSRARGEMAAPAAAATRPTLAA